jgi:hypothetical protein
LEPSLEPALIDSGPYRRIVGKTQAVDGRREAVRAGADSHANANANAWHQITAPFESFELIPE